MAGDDLPISGARWPSGVLILRWRCPPMSWHTPTPTRYPVRRTGTNCAAQMTGWRARGAGFRNSIDRWRDPGVLGRALSVCPTSSPAPLCRNGRRLTCRPTPMRPRAGSVWRRAAARPHCGGTSLALIQTLADFGAVSYFGCGLPGSIARGCLWATASRRPSWRCCWVWLSSFWSSNTGAAGRRDFDVAAPDRCVGSAARGLPPPLPRSPAPCRRCSVSCACGNTAAWYRPSRSRCLVRFIGLARNTFALAAVTSHSRRPHYYAARHAARLFRKSRGCSHRTALRLRLCDSRRGDRGGIRFLGAGQLIADWARAVRSASASCSRAALPRWYPYLVRFRITQTVEAGLGKIRPSMEDFRAAWALLPVRRW